MFDLALALGVWDVDGMANEMPLSLYFEWMAYGRLNPFGEWRADLRAASIQSTMVNLRRSKGQKLVKSEDFMPRFKRAVQKKSPRERWELLKMALKPKRLKDEGGRMIRSQRTSDEGGKR